jgi:hypothetical protein
MVFILGILLLIGRHYGVVNSFFFYLFITIVCLLRSSDTIVIDINSYLLSCPSTLPTCVDTQHDSRHLLTITIIMRLLVLVLSLVLDKLVVAILMLPLHRGLFFMLCFYIVFYLLLLSDVFLWEHEELGFVFVIICEIVLLYCVRLLEGAGAAGATIEFSMFWTAFRGRR